MRHVLAGLVLCGLALLSHQRAAVWQSNLTLWQATVDRTPTPRAYLNLGAALIDENELEAAKPMFYRGWQLGNGRNDVRLLTAVSLVDLGAIAWKQQDVNGARIYGADVVRRFPTWQDGLTFCQQVGCE